MRVSDVSPAVLYACGAALGALGGAAAAKAADVLPRRYGITHLATEPRRRRRNVALVVASVACALGLAHIVAGHPGAAAGRASSR